jgi:hypothetical protein
VDPLALDHDMGLILLEWIALNIFSPLVLGAMTLILAGTYICDARRELPPKRGSAGNIIKAINWLILGIAFLSFWLVPLLTWRAMLRVSVGLLVTSYLAYKIYDIEYAARQITAWIGSRLKSGFLTR